MKLGIYCPTRGRPHKLKAVADNLKQNTKNEYQLYWGVEPFDRESILAAKDTGYPVILNEGEPTYSDALQTIFEQTDEPVFLWANDDFYFLPNWDEGPVKMMENSPNIGVLGLHDGNPNTNYTAISLIRRSYVLDEGSVIDMPGRVLYPYNHNFCDNELTETAKHKGMWDKYLDEAIHHQHPTFTWLGDFPMDDTYRNNNKKDAQDANLFHSRRHLWQ